jgi:hypothetical protein
LHKISLQYLVSYSQLNSLQRYDVEKAKEVLNNLKSYNNCIWKRMENPQFKHERLRQHKKYITLQISQQKLFIKKFKMFLSTRPW